MEVTQEKIEKVAQFANVSVQQAQQALEECGGHQLEAVLLLEQKGRTGKAEGNVWSTNRENRVEAIGRGSEGKTASARATGRKRFAREVVDAIAELVRGFARITIDIWRGDDLLAGIPLIICVLLFLAAPYVMIPLALIGILFLNCRYHISGWTAGEGTVNRGMDEVADRMQGAVKPLRKRMKQEMERYARDHRKDVEQNKK